MKKTFIDKSEEKLIRIAITIGLILSLILWQIIPVIILKLLNIDINNINKTIKVLILFVNDCLLLILMISIYRKTIINDYQDFFNHNFKKNLIKSITMWLIGLGIMIASNYIIFILTDGTIAQNEEDVRTLIDSYPLYMAFQLIIYAPITEELIFRKSIKDITNNKIIYIFLSGLIFGGLHVLSSLSNPEGLLYLIPYCSLGFIFAYLYHKTDNIFSTITIHSFHNSLALLIYLRRLLWKKY